MVESTIAEYIADETSFVLGTDITLSDLEEEDREGISFRLLSNVDADGILSTAIIDTLLFYYDYVIGRGHLDTLASLFDARRGTIDGTWTVAGEVLSQYLGKDPIGRYVFAIRSEISYDKSML